MGSACIASKFLYYKLELLILIGSIRLEESTRELKYSNYQASYIYHRPMLVPTLIHHSRSQQQLYKNWPVHGLSQTRDLISS